MSLTATCGVLRTAGSRGASMLAVMWWVAPWTGGVVRLRHEPLDRTKPRDCLKTTDSPPTAASHEPARSEVARAHSASDRIPVFTKAAQPGAPGAYRAPAEVSRRAIDFRVRRPGPDGLRRGLPCPPFGRPAGAPRRRPRAPPPAWRGPAAPTDP